MSFEPGELVNYRPAGAQEPEPVTFIEVLEDFRLEPTTTAPSGRMPSENAALVRNAEGRELTVLLADLYKIEAS